NGYAAPPIPAVLAIANGVFAENSRAGSACHNPCRALICHLQPTPTCKSELAEGPTLLLKMRSFTII
ncbi:MAG: hypothetical protein IIT45_11240, partial [Treponema sp.]|nr:hypothetical protein [Treponema sp.]